MTLPPGAIVIAGGSGFLGLSLATFLAAPATPVILLSRNAPRVQGPWTHIRWDARTPDPSWVACLENASALVNLTGRSVDCVKTPDRVDEILRSRVESTLALGHALRAATNPPPVWVQMSTAHIYGDPPQTRCSEDSPLGHGLAPDVGRAWENAFNESLLPSQRGVVLRTSFVIGRDRGAGAGAMSRFRTLARLGLAGTIGHGRQGISWIHETDLNRLIAQAIADASMHGVYIASAPHPPRPIPSHSASSCAQCDARCGFRSASRRPHGSCASERHSCSRPTPISHSSADTSRPIDCKTSVSRSSTQAWTRRSGKPCGTDSSPIPHTAEGPPLHPPDPEGRRLCPCLSRPPSPNASPRDTRSSGASRDAVAARK